MLVIFVFAVADLPEAFRLAGDRCAVIGQELLISPAFSLKPKKALLGILGDGGEQFTASLGRYDVTVRMSMNGSPVGEATEGIFILKNQVIGNGQNLAITIGEASLQSLLCSSQCGRKDK